MRILFIATGFPPAIMSENLCNGKLILSFLQEGWEVDVITKNEQNMFYAKGWIEPWMDLKLVTHIIDYPLGNKVTRMLDMLKCTCNSSICKQLDGFETKRTGL
jgi:hypothetical protein